jgi:tetratricopeptide (TPR) repeat protein
LSVSHGKASAYLPVLDLLQGYFKITSDDDARSRREKVAGKIAILDRALEDSLPYLFALLGVIEGEDPLAQMDGQAKKRRTLEAVKRILLRESLNQSLIVIFEDLHWIDEETQVFLNLLADSIGTAKILLMVNYRPEYSHQWHGKTYYTQLRLDPLGTDSAEEMLAGLLGDGEELAPLKRLIIEKTEGTPFFIEETVQALLDEGALVRNGATKLARPLAELKIPLTVQAVLAARIDRLSKDAKDLLQTLAVVGRELQLSLIRMLVTKSDDETNRMLDELQFKEFVYEQPAAGETEYIFKHALTQEVAYNSVLVERRRNLHERVARAIEEVYSTSVDEHLNELARHYTRSTNVEKAVEYLKRAGTRSLNRSLYVDARSAFETALGLLEKSQAERARPSDQLRLLNLLAQALYAVEGGFTGPATEAVLNRALGLAAQVDDVAQVHTTLLGQWVFNLNAGRLIEGRSIIERMEKLAADASSPALIAITNFPAANTYFHLGEFETAARYGQEGVNLWRKEYYDPAFWQGDPRVFGFSFRGRALATMGYPDSGLECIQQALAIAKQEPSKFTYLVLLLEHVCWFGALMSDSRLSLWMFQEAMRLADEIEYAERNVVESYGAWPRAIATGEYQDALEKLETLIDFEKKRRSILFSYYHAAQLADLCARAGLAHRGLKTVEQALSFAQSSGASYNMAELWRIHGELSLLQDVGNRRHAKQAFERAIEIAHEQKAKLLELRATISLARLSAREGHSDEGRAMLAEIYNWFTEGFDTPDLKDAKALLDELSK